MTISVLTLVTKSALISTSNSRLLPIQILNERRNGTLVLANYTRQQRVKRTIILVQAGRLRDASVPDHHTHHHRRRRDGIILIIGALHTDEHRIADQLADAIRSNRTAHRTTNINKPHLSLTCFQLDP